MSEFGTLLDRSTVHFERVLPGTMERVWHFLTNSEARATWLGGGPMDLRVGGQVELRFDNSKLSPEPEEVPAEYAAAKKGNTIFGEVTRCDPPRVLSFTWGGESGNSEVTFELSGHGNDQVKLSLTHRRLGNRQAMLGVASGWHTHLGILERRLEGAPIQPFWTSYSRNKAEYQRLLPAS